MYERTEKRFTVRWTNYGNESLAAHAMELTPDTGVPEHANLPDEAYVPVEADVARKVRHKYRELVLDRDIREAEDGDEAERLKERYKDHTGEEWEE